jgi:type VI secretion system protein ImpD
MKSRHQKIAQLIADIDNTIQAQVSLILHESSFKALEARWRGLHYLVTSNKEIVKHTHAIKMLCITSKEFEKDLGRVSESEQTQLFKIIYNYEYDMAGGSPFGLMLLDLPVPFSNSSDSITMLENIIAIAGASFLPFLIPIEPNWLNLETYNDLASIKPYHHLGPVSMKSKLQRLRSLEDARYVFFLCQRYLWREPYQYRYQSNDHCSFYEVMDSHEDLCWGSAAYLVAQIVLINYHKTSWFSDINQQKITLPHFYHQNDFAKVTPLPRLEVTYFNEQSDLLSNLGCLTLQEHSLSHVITIDRAQAWYQASEKNSVDYGFEQTIVCALTYLLCACRFAHYLKVLGRHKIGSFMNTDGLQSYLQSWIFQYCGQSDQFNKDQWVKYPLRSAHIEVVEQPHLPGHYLCKMDLKPNFRIDQIDTHLRLQSVIGQSRVLT